MHFALICSPDPLLPFFLSSADYLFNFCSRGCTRYPITAEILFYGIAILPFGKIQALGGMTKKDEEG